MIPGRRSRGVVLDVAGQFQAVGIGHAHVHHGDVVRVAWSARLRGTRPVAEAASATATGCMPQLASCVSSTRRLVALSSTTSTLRPGERGRQDSVSEAAGPRAGQGSNQNLLPAPGSLSRPISPPMTSVRRREMARPSPVPP